MSHLHLVVYLIVTATGCAPRTFTQPPPPDLRIADTSLGPGDTFEIRVLGEKDLSGDFQVSSDGSIDFPLLGPVRVAGKESNVVAAELASALRDRQLLRDPHVSVRIREATSKRISVLGAVAKPGTLPMIAGMTIVQAISQAGGFAPLANKDETVVTRRVNGKLQRYRVTMSEITRGNTDDFSMSPGDIVFVPERVF